MWQEIIKLESRINKVETQRTIQRINETESCFFEKINKIDELWSKLSKKERLSKLTKSEPKWGHNNRY